MSTGAGLRPVRRAIRWRSRPQPRSKQSQTSLAAMMGALAMAIVPPVRVPASPLPVAAPPSSATAPNSS